MLLPGPDALVAPAWVPWERAGAARRPRRRRPAADRRRTTTGWCPAYLASDDPAVEEVARRGRAGPDPGAVPGRPRRTPPSAGRTARTGPGADMARAAPAHCGTCGFFLPLAGSLRAAFGVCGNELRARPTAPVVHVEFGCGAHSDVAGRAGLAGRGGRAGLRRRGRPGAGRQLTVPRSAADPFGTAALRAAVLGRLGGLARPGSARTPTPRRTCGSAATPTPGWSSWRRTPPTRPGPPACRAGCASLVPTGDRRAAGGQHRRRRWTPPGWPRWPRCARRPSGTTPARSAGSGSGSPRCSRSATRRGCVAPAAGSRSPPTRTARGGRPALPGPAAELARRDEPPVLRLVWPVADEAAAGRVRHRGPAAAAARASTAAALLDQARGGRRRPAAGAARPGRDRGRPARPVRRAERRRPVEVTIGDAALAAGPPHRRAGRGRRRRRRPPSSADRRDWTVCWALPLAADGAPGPAGRATCCTPRPPPPSGSALPARLIATLPMEPDRRRVRPGPATDAVLARPRRRPTSTWCGPSRRRSGSRWCRAPGFPRSELDGRLRELLLDALRGGAAGCPARPAAELVPGPGASGWTCPARDRTAGAAGRRPGSTGCCAAARRAARAALAELGVHRLTRGRAGRPAARGASGRPAGGARCTRRWRRSPTTVPGLLDELRALPVPLADGRTVAGPPTVLLPDRATVRPGDRGARRLAALGLPGPARRRTRTPCTRCSARLGAGAADPAALLEHPALVEAVDRSVGRRRGRAGPGAAGRGRAGAGRRAGPARRARPASARWPCPTPTATRPGPTS